MPAKNILILSYTFPPAPGIGGRRWAKFAKYLVRNNHCNVYVLTCRKSGHSSPWAKDVESYQHHIFFFEDPYPAVINLSEYSFLNKILYRVALMGLKLKHRGNVYDRSMMLKQPFIEQVKRLIIEKKVDTLLVSGGPFYWMYTLLKLKPLLPHVQFVADFRDPWANNKTAFGYAELPPQRLAFEQKAEQEVVAGYNKILSVSDEMNEYFLTVNGHREKGKFFCIPNGFDRDDLPFTKNQPNESDRLQLIFTGTLYHKTKELLNALAQALTHLKTFNPELYQYIRFNFYGDSPRQLQELFKPFETVVFHGVVSLQKVYEEISESDVCMLFLTDDLGYSLSTKFYEYVFMKKPILVFSAGGSTADFVVNNKLGYATNADNIRQVLENIVKDKKENTLRMNPAFDSSMFDVNNISQHLYKALS